MGEIRNLTTADVKAGDRLPELRYDVSATTIVLGAMASRDWRPMHHDHGFAVDRNGMRDIFMNTPNLAAWFERYLTDWSGPKGRLGKVQFRMKDSIYPGDTMVFHGSVDEVGTDDSGCGWASIKMQLTVGEKVVNDCSARIALPVDADDNPWKRSGEDWKP